MSQGTSVTASPAKEAADSDESMVNSGRKRLSASAGKPPARNSGMAARRWNNAVRRRVERDRRDMQSRMIPQIKLEAAPANGRAKRSSNEQAFRRDAPKPQT